jgi:DNA-binding CsgD family transcriptional regulator
MASSAHVLILAHLGRLEEARELGEADLAADESVGFVSATALHCRSLGFTALMAGDVAAAATFLLRMLVVSVDEVGIGEPALLRAHADAVMTLVALGRLDEAQRVTDQLDASAALNRLPWSIALAGRCHGQIRAAAGDVPAALDCFELSLAEHARLPMPFEAARTRMLYAGLLRRSGLRSDARREFEAAQAVFVQLGTPLQVQAARVELASLGRRTAAGELTATEDRIAALVGVGRTNREVAAALVISVRTVESHLGRIYRKLGLRSRTELSRHASADSGT